MQELNPMEWAVRPLKRYAIFSGRAPRAEYWWYTLAIFVMQIPLTIIDESLADWGPLSSVFSLATLVPSIAVTVRRLHDTNRSGWWLLAFVAGFGAVGFMAVIGAGARSTAATFTGIMVAVLLMLVTSITLLVFMVLPGTEGPNDYGPDPYGPDQLEEVFA